MATQNNQDSNSSNSFPEEHSSVPMPNIPSEDGDVHSKENSGRGDQAVKKYFTSSKENAEPEKRGALKTLAAENGADVQVVQPPIEVEATANAANTATLSPFERQRREYIKYKNLAGDEWNLFLVSQPLRLLPEERRQELGLDQNSSATEKAAALHKLTQEEVDKYTRAMIVPRWCVQLQKDLLEQIVNSGNEHTTITTLKRSFVETATHIEKTRTVPLLTKSRAQYAFFRLFSLVLACDRYIRGGKDTNGTVAKTFASAVEQLLRHVLRFQDSELGFFDPFSRQGLFHVIDRIRWIKSCSYKTPGNCYGMGQSVLDSFLAAVLPALSHKIQTILQITIWDFLHTSQATKVVVSGDTDMNKLGQLAAFLTRNTEVFAYHQDNGTCLSGSRFELAHGTQSMWLSDNKENWSNAATQGASWQLAKNVKIVQIFQGQASATDEPGEITFDSPLAQSIGQTPGSVTWVAPHDRRYYLSVHSILPAAENHDLPLPRVVHQRPYHPQAATGFGYNVHACNAHLLADRPRPAIIADGCADPDYLAYLSWVAMSKPLF